MRRCLWLVGPSLDLKRAHNPPYRGSREHTQNKQIAMLRCALGFQPYEPDKPTAHLFAEPGALRPAGVRRGSPGSLRFCSCDHRTGTVRGGPSGPTWNRMNFRDAEVLEFFMIIGLPGS